MSTRNWDSRQLREEVSPRREAGVFLCPARKSGRFVQNGRAKRGVLYKTAGPKPGFCTKLRGRSGGPGASGGRELWQGSGGDRVGGSGSGIGKRDLVGRSGRAASGSAVVWTASGGQGSAPAEETDRGRRWGRRWSRRPVWGPGGRRGTRNARGRSAAFTPRSYRPPQTSSHSARTSSRSWNSAGVPDQTISPWPMT